MTIRASDEWKEHALRPEAAAGEDDDVTDIEAPLERRSDDVEAATATGSDIDDEQTGLGLPATGVRGGQLDTDTTRKV
jgi:hypothetical protein